MNEELNRSQQPTDEEFADTIPSPEEAPTGRTHKVVRVVEPEHKEPEKPKKQKKGFLGEFLAGAAEGAKTVGENISAGAKTLTEKKETPEKVKKAEETPVDEISFEPKESKKASPVAGLTKKLDKLPTGAILGGAAALIVALVAIILICATSCGKNKPEKPVDPTPSQSTVIIDPTSSEPEPEDEPEPIEVPERAEKAAEAKAVNKDVVGWLYIPGLEDVDAGVCQDTKKYSYNKRDITGKTVSATYWIDGAYYTHLRNTFGDDAAALSTNTVIFGHSDLGLTHLAYQNDDPTGPLFSQLFSFKDPSFAEKTPYIYFSTDTEDYVFQVYSVFYNDAKIDNGKALWYIEPTPGNKFQSLLDIEKERSIYDYDVEVTTDDKILTLSTCTVAYGLGSRANYRFVIAAKLIDDPTTVTATTASFTLNEDAPIPKSYEKEFKNYLETWKPAA